MATKKELSEGAQKALGFIKEGCETAAEIKSKGFQVYPAHLNVLVTREYVTSRDVKLVCPTCGCKRKVKAYTITKKGVEFEG